VDVRFTHVDGREHPVEELACAADERLASEILVAPRRLPDDEQRRPLGTAVEAQVLGGRL